MTAFIAFYPCLSGLGELSAQWLLFGRLLGKKSFPKKSLPLFLLSAAGISLPAPLPCKFLLLFSALSLYGTAICGKGIRRSFLSALLATELMQLCYGVFQPVLMLLSSLLFPIHPFFCGLACMVAGDLLSIGLACLCGYVSLRHMAPWDAAQNRPLLSFAIPLLLIFLVSSMAAHSFYGNTVTIDTLHPVPILPHLPVLLIQLLGLSSVFCILYFLQRLSALAFQKNSQEQYVLQAQARWDDAKALRHDMKNHISIIRGLLEKGDAKSAASYAASLDAAAACLSAPFHTGRPACDILISEKAALAERREISFRSDLQIPASCHITDWDFCILLSNALDNAINACGSLPPCVKKFVRISSLVQGDFLLLTIENSFDGNPHIHPGTGLSNMRHAAKKNGGAMEIRTTDTVFHLSILLRISQHPSGISQQFH